MTETGDGIFHWVVTGPAGTTLEWDAEVVNQHPGEMIAWQSLSHAEVHNAGSVRFEDHAGGTDLKVTLKYQPAAGAVGVAVAKLFGENPERKLEESLLRFKQWMEAGAAQFA